MAMMISWVARVNPSHPYLENDPAPSFAPTICAFHLGFGLVAERNEHAERFEDALWKLKRLLSPQIIRKLSNFAFVRNSLGGVSQPDNTYLRTQLNGDCLGQEAPFVVGDRPSLYKQLRCREMPRSEDILKHISALRERQEPPANRDVLYTTLVEALRTEKKLWILSLAKRSYG